MLPDAQTPEPSLLPACPLCAAPHAPAWHRDARRPYHRCPTCALVFVPAAWHLDAEAESAQYRLHDNRLDDPAYRRFLARLAEPALARIDPCGATGIDVGCGAAPLLARMLSEAGVAMDVWDPQFFPDRAVLARRHDLVTASEVVEHFRAPAEGWALLFGLLRPGGLLAVMTKRVRDQAAFARWHYILDPTHIAFYDEATFRWLAARHGAALEVVGDDVVAFRAPAAENAPMPDTARP